MAIPQERYERAISHRGMQRDPAQAEAVRHLDMLYIRLIAEGNARQKFWRRLGRLILGRCPYPLTGLYLWGGVGRGKTWLMDLFYDALPFADKQRIHFQRFMRDIHLRLQALKGRKNPLRIIARDLSRQWRILCLDEFYVEDITDAMLLYGLLDAMFREGITLVTTSNRPPDDLYKNGLQRQRFVPAIGLLKQHTRVLNVDSGTDYRLRLLEQADTYITDCGNDESRHTLAERMKRLAPTDIQWDVKIGVNHRPIDAIALADDVAWFSFGALCSGPRAAADYAELAGQFHTLIVSDVPIMDERHDDKAQRFIHLIDELYDRNVKLLISAAAGPADLYRGNRLSFGFQRTISRLEEMRSHEYLARPHKPYAG